MIEQEALKAYLSSVSAYWEMCAPHNPSIQLNDDPRSSTMVFIVEQVLTIQVIGGDMQISSPKLMLMDKYHEPSVIYYISPDFKRFMVEKINHEHCEMIRTDYVIHPENDDVTTVVKYRRRFSEKSLNAKLPQFPGEQLVQQGEFTDPYSEKRYFHTLVYQTGPGEVSQSSPFTLAAFKATHLPRIIQELSDIAITSPDCFSEAELDRLHAVMEKMGIDPDSPQRPSH